MSDERTDQPPAGRGGSDSAETISNTDDKLVHLRPPQPCPGCGKPSTRKAFPFCSARCADVDLNRWLTGSFVIPGRALDDADEEES